MQGTVQACVPPIIIGGSYLVKQCVEAMEPARTVRQERGWRAAHKAAVQAAQAVGGHHAAGRAGEGVAGALLLDHDQLRGGADQR
jgi:hypothetical protein